MSRKDRDGNPVKRTMKIGSFNMFEFGSIVNTSDIGDYNEFQMNCRVGGGCIIGNSCSITP